MVTKGADYSWDRPDLQCLWNQGVRFIVRYSSRDPSKNLTKAELDQALALGMSVCVVFQEGKTQMERGRAGGETDARDADAFVNGLGLGGIPVYFACDQDWEAASSSAKTAIDAYCDGAKSVIGLARMGGYGDDTFCRQQLDRGAITYAWQTYAWSEGAWEGRAQLRQVNNNVSVCGGLIDWDEAWASDYGQWPRPGGFSPAPPAATGRAATGILIPPKPAGGEKAAEICLNGSHRDFGLCADATVLPGPLQLRVAFRIEGENRWDVHQVTVSPQNVRPVIRPRDGRNYDGVSVRRQDSQPSSVWVTCVPAPATTPPPQQPPSGGGVTVPPLHVDYFGTDHNRTCPDVRTWQQKMHDRGWHEMIVDGDYGDISKDICIAFQQEKGLNPDGYVGPETWNATWTAPA
jgi:hypothetical protein